MIENNTMMKKPGISAVVPVYNEEKSVENTVRQLRENLEKRGFDYEIITVNDCSTDRTAETLSKIDYITVITHKHNKGYGASIKTGIKSANFDWILITDADGTYPLDEVPTLLSHIPDFDMVVGARTGKRVHVPLMRRPAKWFISKLAEYLTSTSIPDLNSGLRVFRKDIAIRFQTLFPDGFSFTTTLTIATLTNNYDVKFIPINYYKREGKSSINPIKDFAGFVTLIFRLVTYFNPLKIYSLVSMMLIAFSLVLFAFTKLVWRKYLDTTVIVIALTGLQIFLTGLLADLVVKLRKADQRP